MERRPSSFSKDPQEIASQLREYHRQLRLQQHYHREYYPQLQLQEYRRQLQEYHRHQQQLPIDCSRLTSFLEYDDSFFSPWNWKPVNDNGVSPSHRVEESRPRPMEFQPGSFFSYDVLDVKFGNMNLEEEVIDEAPSSTNISNSNDGSSSIEIDDYEEISSHSKFANASDYEESSSHSNFANTSDYEEISSHSNFANTSDYEEISSHSNFANTSDSEEISKSIEADNEETLNFVEVGDEDKEEEEEEDGKGEEAEGDEEGEGDGKEKEDEDRDYDEEEDTDEDWVKIH